MLCDTQQMLFSERYNLICQRRGTHFSLKSYKLSLISVKIILSRSLSHTVKTVGGFDVFLRPIVIISVLTEYREIKAVRFDDKVSLQHQTRAASINTWKHVSESPGDLALNKTSRWIVILRGRCFKIF